MNKTIDYFIDSEKDLASFEYYFEEELNIKSVTLKSIMFYAAYVDIKQGILYKRMDYTEKYVKVFYYPIKDQKEFNLNDYCDFLDISELSAIKFHNVKNHLIIELPEDRIFTLPVPDPPPNYVSFNELFGFKQEKFTKKGKYRSPKSIINTLPILYLRSNLVDKQNTFYNNKYSDIFCEFPVDIDIDAQKLQIYEPPNCTKTYINVLITLSLRFQMKMVK